MINHRLQTLKESLVLKEGFSEARQKLMQVYVKDFLSSVKTELEQNGFSNITFSNLPTYDLSFQSTKIVANFLGRRVEMTFSVSGNSIYVTSEKEITKKFSSGNTLSTTLTKLYR